jgi:hypothetical protein
MDEALAVSFLSQNEALGETLLSQNQVLAVSLLSQNSGLFRALRRVWRSLPAWVRTIFALHPTAVFAGFRALLRLLPKGHRTRIYGLLEPTGLHHCFNYLADYRWIHRPEHFAASILPLQKEFEQADEHRKRELSDQFVQIVEGIVLNNGVKKTTSFLRQSAILSQVLPGLKLSGDPITVLDVPSSIGIASLATYDLVSARWPIASYVLGDLSFELIYDKDTDCVFDACGDLLQVGGRRSFFSVYRPAFSSGRSNVLSTLILSPLHLRSWYTKRKYRLVSNRPGISIALLHPEVEKRVKDGIFHLQKTDIFSAAEGKYDLILSFNLLVTRYFPREKIAIGRANLAQALNEGGALVMGDDTSHQVFQKINGQLVLVRSEGEL